MTTKVDHTALQFNQACIVTLLVVAFLLDQIWLVAFVGAVMLIGTIWPRAGLFKRIYSQFIRPAGWLKPKLVTDKPQPHLFAQGVGGLFLVASVLAFGAGSPLLSWILAGIVVILAAVNLFLGFCMGCFMYFQLARRGINIMLPGWHKA